MTEPFVANPSLGKVPNKDYTVTTPGGGAPSDPVIMAGTCHQWHLVSTSVAEPVTIVFIDENRSITRKEGLSGNVSRGFSRFALQTASPQTILISCGDETELDSRPGGGGGGGAFPQPALVQGVNPFGAPNALSAWGNPITPAMYQENGGLVNPVPLQTSDGQRLLVDEGPNTIDGFAWQTGMVADTTQTRTLALFFPNGAGVGAGNLQVLGVNGLIPMGIYPGNGTGPVYAITAAMVAANNVFYVPCVGIIDVHFGKTVAGADWSFGLGRCNVVFKP